MSKRAVVCLACAALCLIPSQALCPGAAGPELTVWVVETTPGALVRAEKTLGIGVEPGDFGCIVTLEQGEALVKAILDEGSGRTVARGRAALSAESESKYSDVEQVDVAEMQLERPAHGDQGAEPDLEIFGHVAEQVGLAFRARFANEPGTRRVFVCVEADCSWPSGLCRVKPGMKSAVTRGVGFSGTIAIPVGSTLLQACQIHPVQDFGTDAGTQSRSSAAVALLLIEIK